MGYHNAQRRHSAQAVEFRQYVKVFDVAIVGAGRRTLGYAGVIIAVCFALNLIAPLVISAQRTLTPGTTTMLFDGPSNPTLTITLLDPADAPGDDEFGAVAEEGLVALTEVAGLPGAASGQAETLSDRFVINPVTRYPLGERHGLGVLFPYQPERRSYPFSSPFSDFVDARAREQASASAQERVVLLDYVGAGSVGGLETYKYHGVLGGGVERTVDVERRTGRILNEVWTAPHPADGADGAARESEEHAMWVLAEVSKREALDIARGEVRVLFALQVLALVTRVVAAGALLWALVRALVGRAR